MHRTWVVVSVLLLNACGVEEVDSLSLASDLRFGSTQPGSSWEPLGSDAKSVFLATLPENGTVSSLSSYQRGNGKTGSQRLRGVVYADNNGAPGRLVGVTQEITQQGKSGPAWVVYPFATPISLAAGKYWIGHLAGATNQVTQRAYTAGGSAAWNANAYLSGASDPFGVVRRYSSTFSVYLTYSTTSGGGVDAGTPDAGTPDAGTPDAGTPDAGTPDAGATDGGTAPTSPTAYGKGVWYLLSYGSNRQACSGPGVGHYSYIVMQWYMAVDSTCGIAQIKAANPKAKVLAYQNFGAMIAGPHSNNRPSTGVTQEEAAAHEAVAPQDSWYLHNTSGGVLTYPDYTYLKPANIGRASYREMWKSHLAGIKADGFHGVLADDVNAYPGHRLGSGGTAILEYSTDNAYGDAMVAAVQVLGPYTASQGLLFLPNTGVNPWNTSHRTRALAISAASSGTMREFWMRWNGTGPNLTGAEWESNATFMADVERQGQFFVANTYNGPSSLGEHEDSQYAGASFWVMWSGLLPSAWGMQGTSFSEYHWGTDIGLPLDSARVAVGVGWRRRYSAGIAIVNPHPSSSQVFSLGGSYVTPDGVRVSSVTLAPGRGMVLVP